MCIHLSPSLSLYIYIYIYYIYIYIYTSIYKHMCLRRDSGVPMRIWPVAGEHER